MSKFVIEPKFWDLFPDTAIGVVIARGINNTEEENEGVRPDLIEMLEQANVEAKKFLTAEVFSENDILMEVHLFCDEFNFCSAGVSYARSVCALIVECGNLVNTSDNLVNLAGIALVKLSHLCGCYLAKLGFSLNVVAEKVAFAECVESC